MSDNNSDSKNKPTDPSSDEMDLTATKNQIDETNIDDGIEIAPETLQQFDFISALDEMNAEKEAMFFPEAEDSTIEIAPVEITADALVAFAKTNGITEMLNIFREALNRLGYIKTPHVGFIHAKSGKTLKI